MLPIQHIYKSSSVDGDLLYAWFPAMHTRVDIALCSVSRSEKELLEVIELICHELYRLEQIGNCYDINSELSSVNRMAALQHIPLSDELYNMLALCKEYYVKTLGCFDVTVHSDNYNDKTMSYVQLSAKDKTLLYLRPGIRLNLSGFLKGYALEKVRYILQEHLLDNALVNLGNSSIMALGNHPAGTGWRLGKNITLHNSCLTVSGNEREDRQHIISPISGNLVKGRKQIAVITNNGIVGEVCSTALFAAPKNMFAKVLNSIGTLIDGYFWE